MKTISRGVLLFLLCGIGCQANRTSTFEGRNTQPVPSHREKSFAETNTFPGKWNTAATNGIPGFQTFRCEFTVPSVPAYKKQSIFLWCGVQETSGISDDKDTSFGVLQPVLMYGPDCVEVLPEWKKFGPKHDLSYEKSPYWYYSAQYVYPDPVGANPPTYKCTSGKGFKAKPGETLISTIKYDSSADAMTVQISAADGSRVSRLAVEHPWNDSSKAWKDFMGKDGILLEGALEIPVLDPTFPIPHEFFDGWLLKATVIPSVKFPFKGNEWKLLSDPADALLVTCKHDSSGLKSDCTWSKR